MRPSNTETTTKLTLSKVANVNNHKVTNTADLNESFLTIKWLFKGRHTWTSELQRWWVHIKALIVHNLVCQFIYLWYSCFFLASFHCFSRWMIRRWLAEPCQWAWFNQWGMFDISHTSRIQVPVYLIFHSLLVLVIQNEHTLKNISGMTPPESGTSLDGEMQKGKW